MDVLQERDPDTSYACHRRRSYRTRELTYITWCVAPEYYERNSHVEATVKKANKHLFFLKKHRRANLPHEIGLTCYRTTIGPYWNTPRQSGADYRNILWMKSNMSQVGVKNSMP